MISSYVVGLPRFFLNLKRSLEPLMFLILLVLAILPTSSLASWMVVLFSSILLLRMYFTKGDTCFTPSVSRIAYILVVISLILSTFHLSVTSAMATSLTSDGDTVTLVTNSTVWPLLIPSVFSLLANIMPANPKSLLSKLGVQLVNYCALNFRVRRPTNED